MYEICQTNENVRRINFLQFGRCVNQVVSSDVPRQGQRCRSVECNVNKSSTEVWRDKDLYFSFRTFSQPASTLMKLCPVFFCLPLPRISTLKHLDENRKRVQFPQPNSKQPWLFLSLSHRFLSFFKRFLPANKKGFFEIWLLMMEFQQLRHFLGSYLGLCTLGFMHCVWG